MQRLSRLALTSETLFKIADGFEEQAGITGQGDVAATSTLPILLGGMLIDKAEAGKSGADAFFRELDTNGDGSVSKIEFRQMMRKLGLTGDGTKFGGSEVDQLFEELDDDHGGSLELAEVASALKRLRKRRLQLDKQQKAAGVSAGHWRERAQMVRTVAEKVASRESMAAELHELKTNPSAELRLTVLISKKQLKAKAIVDKLDADRGGSVDAKEFANGLLALGVEATKEDLYRIFDDLDTDGSKSLSMDEIVNFVSRGHEVQVKAKDYAKQLTKDMKEAEKEGKEGQRRVREMLLTDQREKEEEAQKAIVEAAAKAKAEEAAAAEAKAKAEAAAKAAQQKKEEFERRIEERRIAQSQGKP